MAASMAFPSSEFAFGDELLSGEAWCCDGDIPHDQVHPADLCEPGPGIPAGLEFAGILRPTRIFRPPDDPSYRWGIISHFHGSSSNLLDKRRLKDLLHLLSWDPSSGSRALIEGISDVDAALEQVILHGICHHVRTVDLRWVEPDGSMDILSRLGQLDAFAALLLRLFCSRDPKTRFRLRLQALPSKVVLEHAS